MFVKIVKPLIPVAILCLSSQALLADTLHFEFEVTETRANGKSWDGLSRFIGADPAPDVHGVIKLISGESCEILLQENTFLAQQDCEFTGEVKDG
ncbi:MAG: hypothetical protein KAH84_04545, partial [Thiomargarita sp.]|nr:hypothetical protein [Thiomargarita sp.]